jgi:hypothetical protein
MGENRSLLYSRLGAFCSLIFQILLCVNSNFYNNFNSFNNIYILLQNLGVGMFIAIV